MSEEVSDGVLLWNASLVLMKYLKEKVRKEFDGSNVLELGAGAGHLSLSLSRMGARVTSTEAACVEKEKGNTACKCWGCVEQLRRSLRRQIGGGETTGFADQEWVSIDSEDATSKGGVRVIALEWGETASKAWAPVMQEELRHSETRPDFVIMSEVIYNQSSDSLYDDDYHDNLVREQKHSGQERKRGGGWRREEEAETELGGRVRERQG